MSGRGSGRIAARLLSAAALAALAGTPVFAQAPQSPPPPPPPDAAELDPSAPLDPLPGLGVDWPDLKANDTAAPATATAPARQSTESASTLRYTWVLEGLGSIGAAEDLVKAFKQQSALEAD